MEHLPEVVDGFAFHIFAFMLLSARSTKYLAIEKVKSVWYRLWSAGVSRLMPRVVAVKQWQKTRKFQKIQITSDFLTQRVHKNVITNFLKFWVLWCKHVLHLVDTSHELNTMLEILSWSRGSLNVLVVFYVNYVGMQSHRCSSFIFECGDALSQSSFRFFDVQTYW